MESEVGELQEELDFYRRNQTEMEQEVTTLIGDNQKLSQQVGMLMKERIESARHTHGTGYISDYAFKKDYEELKGQVTLLTKERDSLHVLWHTSQKTIEALEMELKAYQKGSNQSPQEGTRDLEMKFETALSDYIDLESKHKDLQNNYNAIESKLKHAENEIVSYSERGKEFDVKMEEITRELNEHKLNLAVERKNNEILKDQVLLMQKECADMVKKEAEAKSKVAEALQLFDLVFAQKNEAYKKIRSITGEINDVKQLLDAVKRNAETAYRKELDEIKEKYNEKIVDMLQHIKNLDSELSEKGLLLNKALRDVKVLQTANEDYLKEHNEGLRALNPKIAVAEQKLEVMFQELVLSERRNIQMECEKQCLAIDIQRIQDMNTREIKRRDWEETLLRNQCEQLKAQVEHLQKSLEETHAMTTKLQSMITSRDELNQKMLSNKSVEIEELNKHLQNQMDLSKKWKQSYIEMSEKLKQKLESLEKENKDLRTKLNLPTVASSPDESVES